MITVSLTFQCSVLFGNDAISFYMQCPLWSRHTLHLWNTENDCNYQRKGKISFRRNC